MRPYKVSNACSDLNNRIKMHHWPQMKGVSSSDMTRRTNQHRGNRFGGTTKNIYLYVCVCYLWEFFRLCKGNCHLYQDMFGTMLWQTTDLVLQFRPAMVQITEESFGKILPVPAREDDEEIQRRHNFPTLPYYRRRHGHWRYNKRPPCHLIPFHIVS